MEYIGRYMYLYTLLHCSFIPFCDPTLHIVAYLRERYLLYQPIDHSFPPPLTLSQWLQPPS